MKLLYKTSLNNRSDTRVFFYLLIFILFFYNNCEYTKGIKILPSKFNNPSNILAFVRKYLQELLT